MKKITITIASLVSLAAFGQSQRMVLVEEFTQASCVPCAQANPTLNNTLSANASKAVSIKYQTNWPGVDPMNDQNPTDVSKRVTYYDVGAVPNVSMDGKSATTPGTITTTSITKEYGVASPFRMLVTQQLNGKQDSISINCTLTASQDFTTTGPLYLRVALIEKAIIFSKAPGTNGEKEFYNVMRKMYPAATGTSLPVTWVNGKTQTVSFKVVLPTYIYNKAQLGVVAFLQSDNDKVVHQAAMNTNMVTGIEQEANAAAGANVIVFPNPMTTASTVGIQLFESKNVNMQVANALGQTVLSNSLGQLDSGEQMVDLNTSSLKPGLYFLNIYVGEQLITKKIAINYY
jgi:hypothetical protein